MTGQKHRFMCLCEGRWSQRDNAKENGTTNETTTQQCDEQLLAIAKIELADTWNDPINIETHEKKNDGKRDVFEISIWNIKHMLRKAYIAGYEDAVDDYDDETTCDDDNTSLHLTVKARSTPSEMAAVIAVIRLARAYLFGTHRWR